APSLAAARQSGTPAMVALAPAPPTPGAPEAQITLLVLGVDDLSGAATAGGGPTLQAVWLITFRPPATRVFVLGLSPVCLAAPAGAAETRLMDAFASDGGQYVEGGLFPRAVSSLAPVAFNAILTLDRTGFARLIDLAGGADLDGRRLPAPEALAWLDARSAPGPLEALRAQTGLLRGLVSVAAGQQPAPDPLALAALVPAHARLSLPAEQILALAAGVLPFQTQEVFVQGDSDQLIVAPLPDGRLAVRLSQ
ncbi:MAG: hypothetical protein HY784_05390, partial [Chloroflexi bacterium]|nr:hypothetical protein [Chloroflexota bacterium]